LKIPKSAIVSYQKNLKRLKCRRQYNKNYKMNPMELFQNVRKVDGGYHIKMMDGNHMKLYYLARGSAAENCVLYLYQRSVIPKEMPENEQEEYKQSLDTKINSCLDDMEAEFEKDPANYPEGNKLIMHYGESVRLGFITDLYI
jgi:hypothetical protein